MVKKIFNHTYELTELKVAAKKLLDHGLLSQSVCVIEGELGAGKTTLMKAIIESLGIKELVTSPTYSLVNEYSNNDFQIFHMDLYRLEYLEQAYDIGMEEYFEKGICFIEWAEIIESILPAVYHKIEIENLGNFTRRLTFIEIENN